MPKQWLARIYWCCAVCVSFVGSANGETFDVTNTNDSGPGSLRQAILNADQSAGPHAINITATGALQLSSPLPVINKSFSNELSIKGPGAGSLTVDGVGSNRVFFINQGNVTIQNLTIANGSASASTRMSPSASCRVRPRSRRSVRSRPWHTSVSMVAATIVACRLARSAQPHACSQPVTRTTP